MEIGLYTFAELAPNPHTGHTVDPETRIAQIIEEAETAERVGLDVFGLGEHHRPDFAVSAPAVVLAAIAARTERIRLTSAVSVLSSDDPVRVFQEFSELDLISGGRAEIMAGRGSFIESFPLFGYDLDDYDELFAEKLELLLELRKDERISWFGRHRAAIDDVGVYPRPVQDPLPVWLAVGGNPGSFVRAGQLGLPLALAIIGGEPARFAPMVELYRDSARQAGNDPSALPMSVNSHTFVGEDSAAAATEFALHYVPMMNRIGRERGWPPMTRENFEASRALEGSLVVGDPDEVARKISYQHEIFGHQRFLAQISVGSLGHAEVLKAIELLGTEVAPRVRAAIQP
jgi:probable LLM family oxidoreductase